MTHGAYDVPPSLLEQVSPFHIVLAPDLSVRQVGSSLARLCPEVAPGCPLESIVDVLSPRGPGTLAFLKQRARSLFVLRLKEGDLTLRGQMLYDDMSDVLIFLGSPWTTDLATVAEMGLTLEDFAVADNVVDYLLLLQTQGNALEQVRTLAQSLEASAAELSHQALHDTLTRLPNRRLLADRFDQTLRSERRTGNRTGLLVMDLNQFKEVNDTFGHHYGDELLVQVGGRLTAQVRSHDTVARLGGDEFAVLLPEIDTVTDAKRVATKLLEAMRTPFTVAGVDLLVEASIGIVLSGEHCRDDTTLMRHADIAMYHAKAHELGTFVYDPALDESSPDGLALQGDLRRALDRHELVLHYQPKFSVGRGELVGAEALVRWEHPERGLILPSHFIPTAEHTDLIGPLTWYVLDAALAQTGRWSHAGRPFRVAVNISARNLRDETLPGQVRDLLADHGVRADQLVLEITETALMAEPATARKILQKLAEVGVGISIDDFGVGHTSLSQLSTLPVTELKVDGSFIEAMNHDRQSALIVNSIISLGRNLGMTVVAEGVETEQALATLTAFGCDVAQGYLLGRPLTVEEWESWWATTRWRSASPVVA